jgi:hypothetical protein
MTVYRVAGDGQPVMYYEKFEIAEPFAIERSGMSPDADVVIEKCVSKSISNVDLANAASGFGGWIDRSEVVASFKSGQKISSA